MLLASVDSSAYKVVLVLHILAVVVAFSPAFVNPFAGTALKKQDAGAQRAFFGVSAANGRKVYLPALVLVPILGMALLGMSDEVYKFKQAWVWLSLLLWIAITGLVTGGILPNERKGAAGDADAEQKVATFGAIATVLFVVVVVLMVFKPGL